MIVINGKKYAKNDSEFTESLFTKQTAAGYYKQYRNGIILLNHQKAPFAAVVNNRHNEQFFVSCSKERNGYRFLHGCTIQAEFTLGFVDKPKLDRQDVVTYGDQSRMAMQAIRDAYGVNEPWELFHDKEAS